MGARSIMSPMVETVDEVQQYLARARYAPSRSRAVALRVSHDTLPAARRYRIWLTETNAEIVYFAKIETALGAENVDAIADVPGV